MNTFICYPKCSTCKKAEKFLKDNNIEYVLRDIKIDNPNKDEINNYIMLSGQDINSFFNTSGLVYKELGLKDKIKDMTYEEKLNLLSVNGMLIKRPILITKTKVYVGFKEKQWLDLIK